MVVSSSPGLGDRVGAWRSAGSATAMMAGFMEDIAGIGQARIVDQDRAVTDVEPGQEGRCG